MQGRFGVEKNSSFALCSPCWTDETRERKRGPYVLQIAGLAGKMGKGAEPGREHARRDDGVNGAAPGNHRGRDRGRRGSPRPHSRDLPHEGAAGWARTASAGSTADDRRGGPGPGRRGKGGSRIPCRGGGGAAKAGGLVP